LAGTPTPYIAAYVVTADAVRILHGAQMWLGEIATE
jgi:hypothetical protein